jgi:hypothetical protein
LAALLLLNMPAAAAAAASAVFDWLRDASKDCMKLAIIMMALVLPAACAWLG